MGSNELINSVMHDFKYPYFYYSYVYLLSGAKKIGTLTTRAASSVAQGTKEFGQKASSITMSDVKSKSQQFALSTKEVFKPNSV